MKDLSDVNINLLVIKRFKYFLEIRILKLKITIITPCFNCISLIKKTVKSVVIHKNYLDLEYIVIDGKSTDGTLEYLKNVPEIDILISENDEGFPNALNKGMQIASGEIMGWLNAGDFYLELIL